MPAKTAAREGIIAVGTPGSSSRSGGAMPNGGGRQAGRMLYALEKLDRRKPQERARRVWFGTGE